jgi:hypothetical protein
MHLDRSWLTVMLVVFGTRWFLAATTRLRQRNDL